MLHGLSSKRPKSTFPIFHHLAPHYLFRTILGLLPQISLNRFQILESSGLFFLRGEQQQLLFPLPELFFPSLSLRLTNCHLPSSLCPGVTSSSSTSESELQPVLCPRGCPSLACPCQAVMLGYHVLGAVLVVVADLFWALRLILESW